MNTTTEKPKVYCEFIPYYDPDNKGGIDVNPRFDFYCDAGMIASCYDLYIAAAVRAELTMLGFNVVNFPEVSGK